MSESMNLTLEDLAVVGLCADTWLANAKANDPHRMQVYKMREKVRRQVEVVTKIVFGPESIEADMAQNLVPAPGMNGKGVPS